VEEPTQVPAAAGRVLQVLDDITIATLTAGGRRPITEDFFVHAVVYLADPFFIDLDRKSDCAAVCRPASA